MKFGRPCRLVAPLGTNGLYTDPMVSEPAMCRVEGFWRPRATVNPGKLI